MDDVSAFVAIWSRTGHNSSFKLVIFNWISIWQLSAIFFCLHWISFVFFYCITAFAVINFRLLPLCWIIVWNGRELDNWSTALIAKSHVIEISFVFVCDSPKNTANLNVFFLARKIQKLFQIRCSFTSIERHLFSSFKCLHFNADDNDLL